MSKIPELAEKVFADQTTTTNPRLPLISELEEILRKSYTGDKVVVEDETVYSTIGIQPGTTPIVSTLQ
jgi:acetaldehyde dehydrogenase/alcohol dehydrogenase